MSATRTLHPHCSKDEALDFLFGMHFPPLAFNHLHMGLVWGALGLKLWLRTTVWAAAQTGVLDIHFLRISKHI